MLKLKQAAAKLQARTCMYNSSMVPLLPVASTFIISTDRQSRYHDDLSLRISATCKQNCQLISLPLTRLKLSTQKENFGVLPL